MKRIVVIVALLIVGAGIGFAIAWMLNSMRGSDATSSESDEKEILVLGGTDG